MPTVFRAYFFCFSVTGFTDEMQFRVANCTERMGRRDAKLRQHTIGLICQVGAVSDSDMTRSSEARDPGEGSMVADKQSKKIS